MCCVCHEIDDESPNFIVVYDLQSGTLFKKWKPSCNTVSLEISSQGGCVISGLEDARILVWDLITGAFFTKIYTILCYDVLISGNCRFSLSGHTAPVSSLKLDPTGAQCLSTDSECRDRSIRLWDVNKGMCLNNRKINFNIFEISRYPFSSVHTQSENQRLRSNAERPTRRFSIARLPGYHHPAIARARH